MSTRSIIARAAGDGFTDGVYIHCDGYPTGRGPEIFAAVEQEGAGPLLERITATRWWSAWDTPMEGLSEDLDDSLEEWHGGIFNSDCEWIYVIDPDRDMLSLFRLVRLRGPRRKQPFDNDLSLAGAYSFHRPPPDWTAVECGRNYEHCQHYAWAHFPEAAGVDISTGKWLGREPLEIRDAVGFILHGEEWTMSGSGSIERVWDRRSGQMNYGRRWFASAVRKSDGLKSDIHVWDVFKTAPPKPAKGVRLIYPPIATSVAEGVGSRP